MAPSKPLQNDTTSLADVTNNAAKKYGHSQQHQHQQYIPTTPSPLNPRSSRARPATLPRRHTVSGPAPSAEAATSTPVVLRPVRHTRRHSGSSSSLSPTERLMRYKGALAWRSATLRRQNRPAEGPHSDANGDNGQDMTTQKGIGNTTPGYTPSTNEKEKAAEFHAVFLNQAEARDRDRGKDRRPQSPLSYHPVEYYHPYCTDYTTTRPRAVLWRPRGAQGVCCGYSSTGKTTLQHVGFVAVAFLFGIYMMLHAFSLAIGHGTGTGTNTGNPNNNSNSHSLLGIPTRGNASWDMSQGYYR